MMATSGVAADNMNFGEYLQKNLKLYELNNDVKLSTSAAANYIRGEVSFFLPNLTFKRKLCHNFFLFSSVVGHGVAKRTVPNQSSFGRSR